ncbi:hypothetical protein Bca101_009271 [Brassica carinata]
MELGIWIVWLVRAPWIAVILLMVIASIPSSELRLFNELVWSLVGRGKILLPSSSQKWTVPQRYFAHFYVFGVACTTLLLTITWMYAFKMAPLSSGDQFKVWRAVFLLLLMEIQVLRRLTESFYVFKYNPSARMNILAYITGLYYYAAAPLSLCVNLAPEPSDETGMVPVDWWSHFSLGMVTSTPLSCNSSFIRGFADCEWRNRYNYLVTRLFRGWESIIIGWRNSPVVSPEV